MDAGAAAVGELDRAGDLRHGERQALGQRLEEAPLLLQQRRGRGVRGARTEPAASLRRRVTSAASTSASPARPRVPRPTGPDPGPRHWRQRRARGDCGRAHGHGTARPLPSARVDGAACRPRPLGRVAGVTAPCAGLRTRARAATVDRRAERRVEAGLLDGVLADEATRVACSRATGCCRGRPAGYRLVHCSLRPSSRQGLPGPSRCSSARTGRPCLRGARGARRGRRIGGRRRRSRGRSTPCGDRWAGLREVGRAARRHRRRRVHHCRRAGELACGAPALRAVRDPDGRRPGRVGPRAARTAAPSTTRARTPP